MRGTFYYSTISGNTRLVWEALQGFFSQSGVTLDLQDIAIDSYLEIQKTGEMPKGMSSNKVQNDGIEFIVLACGTYGHGQLEKNMRHCIETLWKDMALKNMPCAIVGLGDHRYDREYNMYAGVLLENWVYEHGGQIICPTLSINRSPLKPINQKLVENWAENFLVKILSNNIYKKYNI